MQKVEELLAERGRLVRNLAILVERYAGVMGDIISGMAPPDYGRLKDIVKKFKHFDEGVLVSLVKDGSLEKFVEVYDVLGKVDEDVMFVATIAKNKQYAEMLVHNMSSSYNLQMRGTVDKLVEEAEMYRETVAVDDYVVSQELAGLTDLDKNRGKVVTYLLSKRGNGAANKLEMYFIMRLAFDGSDGSSALRGLVEDQMDKALGSPRLDISEHVGIRGTVSRYNIIPVCKYGELPALLEGFEYDSGEDCESNLRRYSEEKGVGVVLVNRSFGMPMEYDLRSLIDADYVVANSFAVSAKAGLNKQIIKRYETIKILDVENAAAEKVKLFGGKFNFCYVVEKLDDRHFRMLARSYDKSKWLLERDSVKGLFCGLSTRPDRYNSIQSDKILADCFDDRAESITLAYEDLRESQLSGDIVKSKITDGLMIWMRKMLDGCTVAADIRKVVLKSEGLSDVMFGALKGVTNRNETGGEYNLTRLIRFENVKESLMRKINQMLVAEFTKGVDMKASVVVLRGGLLNKFEDILRKIMDDFNKDNILIEHMFTMKEYFLDRKRVIV